MVVLFAATTGYSQRERDAGCRGNRCADNSKNENEMRKLALQERRAEIEFQEAKREIELERFRLGMRNGERNGMQGHHMRHGMKRGGNCPMMKHRGGCHKMVGPFILFVIIIHILLAVWVYKDIRKRDSESGIWIIITLLAGLFGAAVYALVRIGENKK
jgi:hypothetical protein